MVDGVNGSAETVEYAFWTRDVYVQRLKLASLRANTISHFIEYGNQKFTIAPSIKRLQRMCGHVLLCKRQVYLVYRRQLLKSVGLNQNANEWQIGFQFNLPNLQGNHMDVYYY